MEIPHTDPHATAMDHVQTSNGLRRDSAMAALPEADALRAAALKSLISKRRKIDQTQRQKTFSPPRVASGADIFADPSSSRMTTMNISTSPPPLVANFDSSQQARTNVNATSFPSVTQSAAGPSKNPNKAVAPPIQIQTEDRGDKSDPEDGEIEEDTPPPPRITSALQSYMNLRPTSPHLDDTAQSKDVIARPGYLDQLTENHLRQAKDLILDILGFGFEPEDLRVIGLDPGLIAICFAELNLVLPSNIRPDEIPPLPADSAMPPSFAAIPRDLIRFRSRHWVPTTAQSASATSATTSPPPQSLTLAERFAYNGPSSGSLETPSSLLLDRASPPRQSSLPIPPITYEQFRTSPHAMVQKFDTLVLSSPNDFAQNQYESSSNIQLHGPSNPSSSETPTSFTPVASPPPILAPTSPPLAVPALMEESISHSTGKKTPPTAPKGDLQEAALREQLLARKAGKTVASIPTATTLSTSPDTLMLDALRKAALSRKKRRNNGPELSIPTASARPEHMTSVLDQESSAPPTPVASASTEGRPTQGLASPQLPPDEMAQAEDAPSGSTPVLRNPAPLRRVRAMDFIDDMDIQSSSSTPTSATPIVGIRTPIGRPGSSRSLPHPGAQSRTSLIPLSNPSQIIECVIDVTDSESDGSESEDKEEENDQSARSLTVPAGDMESQALIDAQVSELIDAATKAVDNESRNASKLPDVVDEIAKLKRLIALKEARRATAGSSMPPSTPSTPLFASDLAVRMAGGSVIRGDHSIQVGSDDIPPTSDAAGGHNASSDSNGHTESLAEVEDLVGGVEYSATSDLPMDADGDYQMSPATLEPRTKTLSLSIPNHENSPNVSSTAKPIGESTGGDLDHVLTVIADESLVANHSHRLESPLLHQVADQGRVNQNSDQSHSRFFPYTPTFGGFHPHYLMPSSYPTSSTSILTSNTPPEVITHRSGQLSLLPLKWSILDKHDPENRICKFEIPGGGRCGAKCADAHLRDLEPKDDEAAKYLAAQFPNHDADKFQEALRQTRLPGPTYRQDFNARIADALSSLGLR